MKAAQIDVVERTTQLLAGFNLSTAAPELGLRLENAGQRDALLLVLEVLEMEAEAREQRKITGLRRAAQIPSGKTFETLEASTLPAPLMRKLRELARGEFLERAENALAFGLPGVGKSHAGCAIGNALIELGHSVLFRPAYQLVQELLAAKRDLMLPQKRRRLDSFELLVLDDIGYVKQSPEEAEVLFTLIAERYERRSMLITSNLVFSDWERIFKDPMATAAAIDRLVHHATILEFNARATGPEDVGAPILASPTKLSMRAQVDSMKSMMVQRVSNADRASTRCARHLTRTNEKTRQLKSLFRKGGLNQGWAKSEYRSDRPRSYRMEETF